MSVLHLYASSEAELAALVGLAGRQPDVAQRVLHRAWDFARSSLRLDQVLTAGPWDEDVWTAVDILLAALSWADVMPEGMDVAEGLDPLFATSGFSPRLAAQPLALPVPPPVTSFARVLRGEDAHQFARTWLGLENASHPEITEFSRDFLGLAARARQVGRPAPDIVLISPSFGLQRMRHEDPTWPPVDMPERRAHPDFLADVDAFLAGLDHPLPDAPPSKE